MTDEMPSRIQALWGGWHPDDRKWLTEFRKAMRAKYAKVVSRVVLFGSKARGDWNEDSDIDVLVIVRDEAADQKEEIRRVGSKLSLKSTALGSVIARSEGEWASRAAARTQWYTDVEAQGVRVL